MSTGYKIKEQDKLHFVTISARRSLQATPNGVMVMKNKLFIVAISLLIGGKVFAQIDTLNVYLEKSDKHKFGVNLVFENNSNDTILLLTQFRNLSLGGEISRVSGICIEYFSNDKRFMFNWGEMPPLLFEFSEKFVLINPKSEVKLYFNVGYYRFPDISEKKYEVSFFMNYLFGKYRSTDLPTKVEYFQTNRVTIVEPTEEKIDSNL
jgi:hypothetical protein